jgi:hypothetical protein
VKITKGIAQELQRDAAAQGDLLIWVVYMRPLDFPESVIARPHSSKVAKPLDAYLQADTLTGVRLQLPAGLSRLARFEADESQIVETWI